MRYAYGALVLSSLLLQKELGGGPALHSRVPGANRDGAARPYQEGSKQRRFLNTFCPPFGLSWLPKSPLGALFLGLATLLLWLLLETWAPSRTVMWQTQPQRRTTFCSLEPELNPDLETEQDVDLQTLQRSGGGWLSLPPSPPSSCALPLPVCTCTYGKWLTSGLTSYELPCERQRDISHIPVTYEGTLHGRGSRNQDEDSSPEYNRMTSPLRANLLVRTASSSPCSSCCTSSSHSSSSPSSCPHHLKGWDWHSSYGSVSGTRPDSVDESESKVSDPISKLDDPDLVKGKLEPLCVLLVPERSPERERMVPRSRDVPGCFPEEAKPQALPLFAQLNFCERSAYGKENGIVLVAKSLKIQMGPAPGPVAKPDRLKLTFPDQGVEEQKPTGLSLWSHMSFLCMDTSAKHQQGPCNAPEEATPRASPKIRQLPPKRNRPVGSTCKPEDFGPEAFALKNMDETRECLEFHVKKKMVQRQCGIPSVVLWSLRLFHAQEDYRLVQLESGPQKPTSKLRLMPIRAAARNHLDSPSSHAKRLQRLPGTKAFYILHPVAPEKTKKLALSPTGMQLGTKWAAFQGPQDKYVLLSMDPNELRQLLFHLLVKMVDIKRGTFPAVVENSFRSFSAVSPSLLPKLIHRGNKTPRPKDLSLSFVAGEALYLIDLNIRHKYLVYTWKLRTLHTTFKAERTSAPSHPSDPKGEVVKAQAHTPRLPLLILKHPRGKALPASPVQLLRVPSSKKPPSLPPPPVALAKATSPEGHAEKPAGVPMEKLLEKKVPESGAEKLRHMHVEKSVCFLEILAKNTLAHGAPSGHKETPQGPTPQGRPKGASSSVVLSLSLNKEGGAAGAEGETGTTSGADPGAKDDRSAEASFQPAIEGQLRCTVLPASPKEGRKAADGRPDGRRGMEEADGLQLEIERKLCCKAPPPSHKKGEAEALGSPRGRNAKDLQEPPAALPSSVQGNKEAGEKGKSAQQKTEREAGSRRGSRRELPWPSSGERGAAGAKGRGPRPDEGRARQKEASILRASLFLKLELAKQELNLHLKKKLAATLRPPHRAALSLDLDQEAGGRSGRRATRRRGPAGPQPQSQAQPQAKPGRRPFCYVCMPLDETGSRGKRVCWYLPKCILEMNGHRVPQVAHFDSRATAGGGKGCK